MSTLKFKTNMKCNGCIEGVTPHLKALSFIKSWSVDLNSPDKTLTIETESDDEKSIIEAVTKAGFKIEVMNPLRKV